ncbi:hypothetical protein WMY93_015757 [Mugilogobius chulae]|uniref:Uncharacterized protein n=1 Tax=Mugilogobius chulae TaxID=88201 RepID=A0AAW0NRG9_9GOBI
MNRVRQLEEEVRALKDTILRQEALVNELLAHNSHVDAEKTALLIANRKQQDDIEKLSCLLSGAETECKSLTESYQHVKNTYLDDNSEKHSLMKRIEYMKKDADELKNIIDTRQAETDEIRKEAHHWRNRFETSERSLEEVRVQLSAAKQATEELNCKNSRMKEENKNLRQKMRSMEIGAKNQKTLTDQNETLQSEVDRLKQVLDKKQVDTEQLTNEVDQWKNRSEEGRRKNESLYHEVDQQKQVVEQQQVQIEQMRHEVDKWKNRFEERRQDDFEQLRNEVDEWKGRFEASGTSLAKVTVQLSAAQQAAGRSDCKIIVLEEENQHLHHRIRELEMCEENQKTLTEQNQRLYHEVDQQKQVVEQQLVQMEQLRHEVDQWKNRSEERRQDDFEQLRNEVDEWKGRFKVSETSLAKVTVQLSAAQQAAEESHCKIIVLEEENQYLGQKVKKMELSEENQKALTDQNNHEVDRLKQLVQLASSEQAAEESRCANNTLEETVQKPQDMEKLEVCAEIQKTSLKEENQYLQRRMRKCEEKTKISEKQPEITQRKSDNCNLISEVAKVQSPKSEIEKQNGIRAANAKCEAESFRVACFVSEFGSRYFSEKCQDQTFSQEMEEEQVEVCEEKLEELEDCTDTEQDVLFMQEEKDRTAAEKSTLNSEEYDHKKYVEEYREEIEKSRREACQLKNS